MILTKITKLVILIVFLVIGITVFSKQVVAQSCGGNTTCEEQCEYRACSNSGIECNSDSICGPGGTCDRVQSTCGTVPGTCIGPYGTRCSASCPYAGFVTTAGGCSYYPPQPPPTPPPYNTIPPPPDDTGTPPDDSEPPPPTKTYGCWEGACVEMLYGGTTDPTCGGPCPTGGGTEDVTDPLAGQSACEEIASSNMSSTEEIDPGATLEWMTWPKAAGSNALSRLAGSLAEQTSIAVNNPDSYEDDELNQLLKNGMIERRVTSPSDKYTLIATFHEAETAARAIWIYNDTNEAWYFYQGANKPVVIFTGNEQVIADAQAEGYVLIDRDSQPPSVADDFPKRILRTPPDNGDKWEGWGTGTDLRYYIPRGSLLIPYVNCASIIGAETVDMFTMAGRTPDGTPICHPRGDIYRVLERDDTDGDGTDDNVWHYSGNYLNAEDDWWELYSDGYMSMGSWHTGEALPAQVTYGDTRWHERMMFLLMPYRQGGQTNYRNGLIRQAILEIPVNTFEKSDPPDDPDIAHEAKINKLAWGLHTAGDDSPFEPPKQISDMGCTVKENSMPVLYKEPDHQQVEPQCNLFRFTDVTNPNLPNNVTADPDTGELKLYSGKTYRVTVDAKGRSSIYPFYNSNFSADNVNNPPTNWGLSSSIADARVAECGSGVSCHTDASSEQKFARVRGSGSDAHIYSQLFETLGDVTGKTFRVAFWVRSASGTQTIPQVRMKREAYIQKDPPYDQAPLVNEDWATLQFTNLDSTVTNSPQVNTEWRYVVGTGTFASNHPYNSNTSKVQLVLNVPTNGAEIYIDNFMIEDMDDVQSISLHNTATTVNYCSSTWNTVSNSMTKVTDSSFNTEWAIPTSVASGTYMLASNLTLGSGSSQEVCTGNPSGTCGYAFTDCSATCNQPITIQACTNTAPPKPAIVVPTIVTENPAQRIDTQLPLSVGDENKLFVHVEMQGTQEQIDQVTGMELAVTSAKSGGDTVILEGIERFNYANGTPVECLNNNKYCFIIDLTESQFDGFGNELNLSATAINENPCSGTQLESAPYNTQIRVTRNRTGMVVQVTPEESQDLNTCDLTLSDLSAQGRLGDVDGSITSSMQHIAHMSNSYPDNTLRGLGYQGLGPGASVPGFSIPLPFNPPNTEPWINRINTVEFHFPDVAEDDAYMCAVCNPQKSGTSSTVCLVDGNQVPNDGNPSSPEYGYYPDDLNVFVTRFHYPDSWWQVRGGLVHSQGTLGSHVPIYVDDQPSVNCTEPACNPFISASAFFSTGDANDNSSGVVTTNQSNVASYVDESWLVQSDPQLKGKQVNLQSLQNLEDIDYFFGLIDFGVGAPRIKTLTENISDDEIESAITSNEYAVDTTGSTDKNIYVFFREGNLNINLNSANKITIPDNKLVMVYVTGDLTINGQQNQSNLIQVQDGGFLGFFVENSITVDQNIGYTDVNQIQPNLQGIYVAGTDLIIDDTGNGGDLKFVGKGSFIGLGGVQIDRIFAGDAAPEDVTKNAQSPIEMFIFDPDLLVNTPSVLDQPDLNWEEVN